MEPYKMVLIALSEDGNPEGDLENTFYGVSEEDKVAVFQKVHDILKKYPSSVEVGEKVGTE